MIRLQPNGKWLTTLGRTLWPQLARLASGRLRFRADSVGRSRALIHIDSEGHSRVRGSIPLTQLPLSSLALAKPTQPSPPCRATECTDLRESDQWLLGHRNRCGNGYDRCISHQMSTSKSSQSHHEVKGASADETRVKRSVNPVACRGRGEGEGAASI
jgi:hypothetical protein